MKDTKILKIISALTARQNLGQVMNEVSLKGDDCIIERAGKTMVAIISMEKYQLIQNEREETRKALDKVLDKMKGENPETVERMVPEAVNSARLNTMQGL